MMKQIFSFLILSILVLYYSGESLAQDLIVTTQGDSINAEIVKVTEDYIQYVYMDGKRVVRVKSPKSDIKSFRYIFYSKQRTVDYTFDLNNIDFRLAFTGSASWGLDGPPEDANQFFKDYTRKVNSGWAYKLDFNYFLRDKRIGIGATFENFITQAKINNVTFTNTETGESRVGELSDDVRISYIGPLFVYHIDTRKDNFTAFLGAGAGAVFYRNEFIRIDELFASGSTFGFHLSASADFTLTNNFLLGFELSANLASLQSYTIDDGNDIITITEPNDVSRISLSVGLRFTK